MNCPHCNEKIESHYQYCPACGAKIDGSSSSLEANQPPIEQVQTKKPIPWWLKLLSLIAILALIAVTAGILFTESLVDVAEHQLEALREGDIQKAYSYTSKDFQAATSLNQFRDFVEAYPVFFNNRSVHFTQRSIEHHIGTLRGNLTSNDHINTPIEYKVIKEDDKWKILSIRLLKVDSIQSTTKDDQSEELIETAKAQLKDIQEGKLVEAYDYSSQEFKNATSEEAFSNFIQRYPILSHYHVVSFHKPTVRHGVGTLSIILQSDQVAAYVKYYLIYENQKWKIWSMRILSPSEDEKSINSPQAKELKMGPMSIESVSVGDQTNNAGQVANPKSVFDQNLKDLYVDIEIKNGLKGTTINLNLQHEESSSSISARAVIEEIGDSVLMSVFSPPLAGWPKGHYKLLITTSSGLSHQSEFDIE